MTTGAGPKKPPEESKKPLRDVLNVRLDDELSKEIERIAGVMGTTDSEAARQLLQYGIRVQRQLEADDLRRAYNSKPDPRYWKIAEIEAKWEFVDDEEMWKP